LSWAPIDRPLLASSSMCKKASSMQIDHICTTPPRFICRHASQYSWALERSHPVKRNSPRSVCVVSYEHTARLVFVDIMHVLA
ncbi:MAG: hypothetical protein ACXWPI_09425, partial [Ktedonobacterales bacterium]